MENDVAYFTRRADQERSAAERAGNAKAQEAHRELAKCFEGLRRKAQSAASGPAAPAS